MDLSEKEKITEFSPPLLKQSLLTMTNDAFCTVLTQAMRFVSQPPVTIRSSKNVDEKNTTRSTSGIKSDDAEIVPEISLDEVIWHDSSDDCWIVVYDRVFDITRFLEEHPGGDVVLLEHAGRDATVAFKSVGHSREALRALEKYLIGILPEKERIYSQGGKVVLEVLTSSLSLAP